MVTCKEEDCKSPARYGRKGEKPSWCRVHKKEGCVNIKRKLCKDDECGKHACFGLPGTKSPEYCKKHAPSHYVDVRNRQCEYPNCSVQPRFGVPGTNTGIFCSEHAPEDYVDVTKKLCAFQDCEITPCYGKVGSNKPEFCVSHAPEGYVNTQASYCAYPNCNVTMPCFGKPGSKLGEYCSEHAPSDYVDVKNKKCLHPNCEKRPQLGKPGTRTAEYCVKHAPKGYVNVRKKKCKHPGCEISPVFGQKGTKTAEYCSEHAPPDYIDVKNKKCEYPDCTVVTPCFGEPGTKIGKYCKKHAPEGYVDVKHKKCKHPNCGVRPNYSYPGYSPEYCIEHKLPRMVLNPTSMPKEDSKLCEYCATEIHYNEAYCSGCKVYISLEETTLKTRQKEDRVAALLEENDIKSVHNRRIVDGCSGRRPDNLIRANWGNIIIEVDEFQHKRNNYSCECEITRMKQIYYDIGEQYLIFIRYNPDDYKTIGKRATRKEREFQLIKLVNDLLENGVDHYLSVVYMYYDYYVGNECEEIEVL